MNYTVICIVLTLLACGYASLYGGAPERIMAAIILVGSSLTVLVIAALPFRFRHTDTGVMMVDVAVLVAMMILAVWANRFWPIGVVGLQIVAVVGHISSIVLPHIDPAVYALTTTIGIYPMLLLLALGTRSHRNRLTRRGGDRSWVRRSLSSTMHERERGPTT